MKRAILILLFAAYAFAQAPDLQVAQTFTGSTTGAPISNGGTTGAANFRFSFRPTGFTAATAQLETAEDCAGAPCSTWTAIASANVIQGTNPIVWTDADVPPTSETMAFVFVHPWYRINVTSVSGSGTISTLLLGYRGTSPAGFNKGGGGGGSIASTTNALVGNGSGSAIAASGTGTDCVLVNGSSAACGSGIGGSIALDQVAVGSGANAIGGFADFIWFDPSGAGSPTGIFGFLIGSPEPDYSQWDSSSNTATWAVPSGRLQMNFGSASDLKNEFDYYLSGGTLDTPTDTTLGQTPFEWVANAFRTTEFGGWGNIAEGHAILVSHADGEAGGLYKWFVDKNGLHCTGSVNLDYAFGLSFDDCGVHSPWFSVGITGDVTIQNLSPSLPVCTDGSRVLTTSGCTGGGGSIGGSIDVNQVAVGSGTNAISGSSSFTFAPFYVLEPNGVEPGDWGYGFDFRGGDGNTTGPGGHIFGRAGDGGSGGDGGDVSLQAGNGNSGGAGGNVTLSSGPGSPNGDVQLISPGNVRLIGNNINLDTGFVFNGADDPSFGHAVVMNAGNATTSVGYGGGFTFTAGNGISGAGGPFTFTAGSDSSTGPGGYAHMTAGNSAGGGGGDVALVAGNDSAAGNGGNAALTGGNSTGAAGGNIVLTPGIGTGSLSGIVEIPNGTLQISALTPSLPVYTDASSVLTTTPPSTVPIGACSVTAGVMTCPGGFTTGGPFSASGIAVPLSTGIAASRPACTVVAAYLATDTHALTVCDATSWSATLNPSGSMACFFNSSPGQFQCYDSSGNLTAGQPLTGTTGSIGGGLLTVACTSGTATVTGVTTSMALAITPGTYPGDGVYWNGYVSGTNTVTVKVCTVAAITPTASVFNVRAIQ